MEKTLTHRKLVNMKMKNMTVKFTLFGYLVSNDLFIKPEDFLQSNTECLDINLKKLDYLDVEVFTDDREKFVGTLQGTCKVNMNVPYEGEKKSELIDKVIRIINEDLGKRKKENENLLTLSLDFDKNFKMRGMGIGKK